MIGPVTAASAKHHATLWRGEKPWHWAALKSGRLGTTRKIIWKCRYDWQFHATPIHITRYGKSWAFGLCCGRRMLYVLLHR